MTNAKFPDYDRESDTVRVQRPDLYRLLLQFRLELQQARKGTSPEGRWRHGSDYDLSFERLADIVDAATQEFYASLAHRGFAPDEHGPDDRMRCERSPVYWWRSLDRPQIRSAKMRLGEPGSWQDEEHYIYPDAYDTEGKAFRPLCDWHDLMVPAHSKHLTFLDEEPACTACRREFRLLHKSPEAPE